MRRVAFLGFLIALSGKAAFASVDSNGPNGINSSDITIVHGLDGAGIDIGQVELKRAPDPNVGKDEAGTMVNTAVDPAEVFYRQDNTNFAPFYNFGGEVSDHSVRVAGVMISDDFLAQGVVPAASLYSVGINSLDAPQESQYEYIAVSTNHIITHVGGLPGDRQLRAINMSILAPAEDGENPDGTSTATSYIDWSARVHDILYVVGNPEIGGSQAVLADNYNGMTVAFTRKNGAKFREVDPDNAFTLDDFTDDRSFPDILAPGKDILLTGQNDVNEVPAGLAGDGTSFAAPHVTGTVAMLQQHAVNRSWGANAKRHEVMKAVLMNSADKLEDNGTFAPVGSLLGMERTVIDTNGNNWLDSEAYDDSNDINAPLNGGFIPLDDEMGAGHLNASRAFTQYDAGEFNDSSLIDVPVIGWDYGTTTGADDVNRYRFDEPLRGGSFISITLAFDRVVDFENDADSDGQYDVGDTFVDYKDYDLSGQPAGDSQINDLDLYFMPRGATSEFQALAQSISLDSTVDHIFFQVPEDGDYEFWVQQHDADVGTNQNYAVAWWAAGFGSLFSQGDFNGDGTVDGGDLTEWKSAFGDDDGGDANGDGVTDGADFLVWQRNFGLTSQTPTSGTVPEPASCVLALLGLSIFSRRGAVRCDS